MIFIYQDDIPETNAKAHIHEVISWKTFFCVFFSSQKMILLKWCRWKTSYYAYWIILQIKTCKKQPICYVYKNVLTAGFSFPSGFTIPIGWKALVWFRNVHFDPELYPEPKKFDPDRWDVSYNCSIVLCSAPCIYF